MSKETVMERMEREREENRNKERDELLTSMGRYDEFHKFKNEYDRLLKESNESIIEISKAGLEEVIEKMNKSVELSTATRVAADNMFRVYRVAIEERFRADMKKLEEELN